MVNLMGAGRERIKGESRSLVIARSWAFWPEAGNDEIGKWHDCGKWKSGGIQALSVMDYLIVGAGLFGATCARLLTEAGKKVVVIEQREQVGGNCADEEKDGVLIGKYGGHIFHTNSEKIWRFINRFADWQFYEHRVKARYQGRTFSFPINRLTYEQFGLPVTTQTTTILAEIFFKGYSEKQWGRPITAIPGSILKRVPIRDDYDDRYFTDKYQAMPIGGYTKLVEKMLDGIQIKKNTPLGGDISYWRGQDTKMIFTGQIDAFFGYSLGRLEYRSLEFRTLKDSGTFQGCAAINYADAKTPYTRTIEWKYFYHQRLPYTYYTFEYPREHTSLSEPYYPIRDKANEKLYKQYEALADAEPWLLVGGRLGSYQYLNMDQAIGQAMRLVEKELGNG